MTVGKSKRHQEFFPRLEGQRTCRSHQDMAGPTWSPWCTTRSRRQRRPGTLCTSSTGCRQPPSPVSSAQQQHSHFQMCHSPTGTPSQPCSCGQDTSTSGCDTLALEQTHPGYHRSRPWHGLEAGAVPQPPGIGTNPRSCLLPTGSSWNLFKPGATSPKTGRMPKGSGKHRVCSQLS